MTRTGPSKKVGDDFAAGRLDNARAYLQAARDALELAHESANANPIMSQIVNAAIAYADALTAKRKAQINQRDHRGAAKLLRDVLGKELPDAQEKRLSRIVEIKEDVQYGATRGRVQDARKMMGDLEKFAAWVEQTFT
jgi:flagellar biosynthesis/type III secretory pathway protein FliH